MNLPPPFSSSSLFASCKKCSYIVWNRHETCIKNTWSHTNNTPTHKRGILHHQITIIANSISRPTINIQNSWTRAATKIYFCINDVFRPTFFALLTDAAKNVFCFAVVLCAVQTHTSLTKIHKKCIEYKKINDSTNILKRPRELLLLFA